MAVAAALARQAGPGTALIAKTIVKFDCSDDLTVVQMQEADGRDDLVDELMLV
jgi:hypothetical protein